MLVFRLCFAWVLQLIASTSAVRIEIFLGTLLFWFFVVVFDHHKRLILITSIDDLFLNKRDLLDVFDKQVHVFLLQACLNNYDLPEIAGTGNGKLFFPVHFRCNNILRKMFKKTWQKIKKIFDLACLRMVRKNLTRSVVFFFIFVIHSSFCFIVFQSEFCNNLKSQNFILFTCNYRNLSIEPMILQIIFVLFLKHKM